MDTGYSVRDAMTTKPISIDFSRTLEECARVMNDNHVGAVVVAKNGESVGIISEQDIVRKAISMGINPLPEKVGDFMESSLVTIGPDSDIYEGLIKMRDFNIRHLPVFESKRMVGLLTLKDILKIQPSLFELLVEKFEIRESNRKPINRVIPDEGICQECGEYAESVSIVGSRALCSECRKSR